jgi:hypothetical protein
LAKDVPLHDTLAMDGATVVRLLASGESVEYVEGPMEEGASSGLLRMKVRAEKDGATGWVSIKDDTGRRLLGSLAT